MLLIRCLIVVPIVGLCVCSLLCCALFCVISSFAIILMGQRALVALLCLSSCCLVTVIVLWHFLMVPWSGLQCVIVVFPDQNHLLFWSSSINKLWVHLVNSNKSSLSNQSYQNSMNFPEGFARKFKTILHNINLPISGIIRKLVSKKRLLQYGNE